MRILGQAVLLDNRVKKRIELRCTAPRNNDATRKCNKLICVGNLNGDIKGAFVCERCHGKVEVL